MQQIQRYATAIDHLEAARGEMSALTVTLDSVRPLIAKTAEETEVHNQLSVVLVIIMPALCLLHRLHGTTKN